MAFNPNPTPSEYIQHHLQNLVVGIHPENGLSMAHSSKEAAEMGFWALHIDSLMWAIGLGAFFCWMFKKAADNVTTGVPGKLQNFVATIVEFALSQSSSPFFSLSPKHHLLCVYADFFSFFINVILVFLQHLLNSLFSSSL